MAITRTLSGNITLAGFLQIMFSGEGGGAQSTPPFMHSVSYANAGGAEPDIAGWLYGRGQVAHGVPRDLLLAHPTDPLQDAGSAEYSSNLDPEQKLKGFWIQNTTAAGGGSLTVARGAANGAPIFDAAGDAVTLPPGAWIFIHFQTGTAALENGTNDLITVTASSGTVTFDLLVIYGS